jgi:BirA family transcriptional regulator, biotin operon repressor / biotin---[acetyl-CoA-carboxylase] ligase
MDVALRGVDTTSPASRALSMIASVPTDRRLDKLIHLLAENATVIVPGPKIAAEIGVARSTVWDWIERLRSLGVEIKGHQGTGYQLAKLPDVLAPSLLKGELDDVEIGQKIVHFFRTDSTNTVALRLAAEGAAHGTVVLAEEQTAGRGRFGRSWYSERSSGIYASVILRPALSPALAPAVTLMAGVAAHAAVERSTGLTVDIRWPNDLLVNGKKVCGILTEMSADMDRLHAVVVGIGINVNHPSIPAELRGIATSLRLEGGKPYSRAQLLAALLREMEKDYHLLLVEGSSAIAKRWSAASSYARGKRIRVLTTAGAFEGTTAGLAPGGALRIRRDDGPEESLIAGEIVEVK